MSCAESLSFAPEPLLKACEQLELVSSPRRVPSEVHEAIVGTSIPRTETPGEGHSHGDQERKCSIRPPLVEIELRHGSVHQLDLSLTLENPLRLDQLRLRRGDLSLASPGV
jgi:hypothetical protein